MYIIKNKIKHFKNEILLICNIIYNAFMNFFKNFKKKKSSMQPNRNCPPSIRLLTNLYSRPHSTITISEKVQKKLVPKLLFLSWLRIHRT